jgi:HPt (histidine-containing phosphotransfer) domain-containing protein
MNTMPQPQSFFELSEDQDMPFMSSSPVLNETLLAQYEAMDEGVVEDPLLPKLVGIFQKHMPEHLKRLDAGLQKQDEAEVSYVIHKMLGMAHNVGALRLSDFLMVLENSDPDVKLNLAQEDVKLLQQEFEAAAAALDEYLSEGPH